LHVLGIDTMILTGDRQIRAAHLADELGTEFEAELLPEDKLHVIERLRKQGKRVAMIGDGINDASACAAPSR
jgi:Cu+-exporting ATPase